jgi:hypothetical protein
MVYICSMRRLLRGQKAQSVVETAFAVPILVILFMGCVQLIQIGIGQIVVMVAAYEAGRQVFLDQGGLTNGQQVAQRLCATVSSGPTRLSAEGGQYQVTHHLHAWFPIVKNIQLRHAVPAHIFLSDGVPQ